MECQSKAPQASVSNRKKHGAGSLNSRASEHTLQEALDQFIEGDFNVRWQAAKVLKAYGESIHPQLIAIAQTSFDDPDLQGFIVDILGANATSDVLLALVNLLKQSRDEEVRETIVLTLGKQGPRHVDELMDLIEQPDLQQSVLKALIQINHPSTVEGLLRFITHDSSDMRALALEALGQFHAASITDVLRHGLKDDQDSVRAICVKALGLRSHTEVDEGLITTLNERLYDSSAQVCHSAARALGRFNHPLALEYLWRCLMEQSSPGPLTEPLIQALGWSSHPTGTRYLLKLLSQMSEDSPEAGMVAPWPPKLVMELVQVIANLDVPAYQEEIAQRLSHLLVSDIFPFDQLQVQQRLIMAIARLGQTSSIPALIQQLRVNDDRLRFHIIAALKQVDSALSHEKLLFYDQEPGLEPAFKNGIAIALREW